MFYKSKTCNYQTHLLTFALIAIAVVENGGGTSDFLVKYFAFNEL